jgi:hypothetical protein
VHQFVAGFLLGGVAGAAVSIISRLPPFDTLASTQVLLKGLVARFAVGLTACVVGLGLLASGIVTLPLGGAPLPEVIAACTGRSADAGCTTPSLLALLSVAILLGFSERALITFEKAVLGEDPAAKVKAAGSPPESAEPKKD